jgi:hypothetical protein
MNYLKISIGIFLALAASRFVPHPPNFTSLLALTFYITTFFGIKYLPVLLSSFILTDLVIGLHSIVLFTWGTVILISLISRYFTRSIYTRFFGSLFGACLFFLITNFGVWSLGNYGYSITGLVTCYTLAIPFFIYTILSTILYSFLIELIYWVYTFKKVKIR